MMADLSFNISCEILRQSLKSFRGQSRDQIIDLQSKSVNHFVNDVGIGFRCTKVPKEKNFSIEYKLW